MEVVKAIMIMRWGVCRLGIHMVVPDIREQEIQVAFLREGTTRIAPTGIA